MKRLFITFVCSLILSTAFAFDKTSDDGGIWAMVIACVVAMIMLGIAVGFYVLVAILAKNRHRNVLLWVLLSILASPVLIAIILLVVGKANDYEEIREDI